MTTLNRTELPFPSEIVHYASADGMITSHGRTVRIEHGGEVSFFSLPISIKRMPFLYLRITRRLARVDKCNILPVKEGGIWTGATIISQGAMYRYDFDTKSLIRTGLLRQSRNPLHQSICVTDDGTMFFGEYGNNPERNPVPVYRSSDSGRAWENIYNFEAGKARHVHGCFWDPYEKKVWVCTGDFENESHMVVADTDFKEMEWLGNGTQTWRTCGLYFTEDSVIWGMDSELETSYIMYLDRKTRKISQGMQLPGPIVYNKQLSDGWMLMSSMVEHGPSVPDKMWHFLASPDGQTWYHVAPAKKDIWKMPLFKNGLVGFSDGVQTIDEFYIHAEGLAGMDGKSYRCSFEP